MPSRNLISDLLSYYSKPICLVTTSKTLKFVPIPQFSGSHCSYYFKNLIWLLIPGSGNYKDIAPPHSYINVQEEFW